MSDIEIHKKYNIAVVIGVNDKGKNWIRENINLDNDIQYQVQTEYVWELKQLMELEGLTVDIL